MSHAVYRGVGGENGRQEGSVIGVEDSKVACILVRHQTGTTPYELLYEVSQLFFWLGKDWGCLLTPLPSYIAGPDWQA